MPQPTAPAEPPLTGARLGRHFFLQPARGYRFSMDSVLLAHFAPGVAGPVADLGAGCGVLAVLLAGRGLAGPFLAVERDPVLAICCRRNFQAAGLAGAVLEHDLAFPHPGLRRGGFALVVMNPPFFRPGHGRSAPDPQRAAARQEEAPDLAGLCALAGRLLPMGGRLALCHPPSRLDELFAALAAARLTPKRLRLVHGRRGHPARLALIEARKDAGAELLVEAPLTVYGPGREYSPETRAIYLGLCGPAARPAAGRPRPPAERARPLGRPGR